MEASLEANFKSRCLESFLEFWGFFIVFHTGPFYAATEKNSAMSRH